MKYTLSDLLDNFRLKAHRENFSSVIRSIEEGIVFRGTNLWVLILAIFIASLGLNVNSPAVIIGAMLVSPLMGPIMGIGLAMGINDLNLLRKSAQNFAFATAVSLITSTLFFLLSPLNQAHSELLARTAPNVYDVLIAFFGGLAGILATASKLKGNVLPGVAIATALMPPLCTAGYGIATAQPVFFFGAFYLFIINTVFIALTTLLTVRLMRFPFREKPDSEQARHSARIIGLVTVLTLMPSVYFAYQIVQDSRFMRRAERFIEHEAVIPGDYLLQKVIDPARRSIALTFGGAPIDAAQIAALKKRLSAYQLEGSELQIRLGFATEVGREEEKQQDNRREASDRLVRQIVQELAAQNISVTHLALETGPLVSADNGAEGEIWLSLVVTEKPLSAETRSQLRQWLKVRLQAQALVISFETKKPN